jgi:hypothetical protein
MFQMTLHQAISIGRAVIRNQMLHHRGHRVTSRGHLATRHHHRRMMLHEFLSLPLRLLTASDAKFRA